jgi:hypothetical protein
MDELRYVSDKIEAMDERNEGSAPPGRSQISLQREVLAPQRTSSGLGVMLVATGAMFFAVASSAFLLRARSHEYREHSHAVRPIGRDARVTQPRPAVAPLAVPAGAPEGTCGRAIYEGNDDGTVSVVFGLCPDAPTGIEVDRIIAP